MILRWRCLHRCCPVLVALAPSALRLLVLTPRRQRIIDDAGRNSVILPQLYSYDRRL